MKQMDKVEWRVKGLFKADAQKVFEEIGDNKFNYKEIIEKAKSEDSELHKCFEWDNSIAADKYRLSQARMIVQNLVFTAKDVEVQPLRVFQITQEKNVYQPTRVFLENKQEYEGLLSRALRELEAFQKKYATLTELEQVMDAIDNALK